MIRAYVVVGMAFGDEGKGSIVDYLVRRESASTVVRFNGGAQAAHNVVCPEGRHHTFSQFGSGTLAGAKTFLSRFMCVDPLALVKEAEHLEAIGVKDPLGLVSIDEEALITTTFHRAANCLREALRGKNRHGSCGMGVGETVADALSAPEEAFRARDLRDPDLVRKRLQGVQERLQRAFPKKPDINLIAPAILEWDLLNDPEAIDRIAKRFQDFVKLVDIVSSSHIDTLPGVVVFEGAQGVLLDQAWGTFPYVTRSDTTFANALRLLGGHTGEVTRIGVFRTYFTRHGAGPFPTEDPAMKFPDHNVWSMWQENFRYGHFDLELAKRAMQTVHGVDQLAFTCLDHIETPRVCVGYGGSGEWFLPKYPNEVGDSPQTEFFLAYQEHCTQQLFDRVPSYKTWRLEKVANFLGAPIGIVSRGCSAKDKSG